MHLRAVYLKEYPVIVMHNSLFQQSIVTLHIPTVVLQHLVTLTDHQRETQRQMEK